MGIQGLRKVIFASIGSDGIDGVTNVAGAIVDDEVIDIGNRKGLNALKFLENNDTYTYFRQIGNCLIYTGPTGTNVNDLALAIVVKWT